MTRSLTTSDLEIADDEIMQWSAPGRERSEALSGSPGRARPGKRRRRRQVIPAWSGDGE